MEEKRNFWTQKNSNGSLQTRSCDETKFCNNTNSLKFITLDPPLEFQDKSAEVLVENFAANFISKLFFEAFKMIYEITWSVSCLQDCQTFNLLFRNNSVRWHNLKLFLTSKLIKDKKLSDVLPLFSESKNSFTKLNNSKIENSEYTKTNIPDLLFTSKTISDMYTVPFDSDIYAIPFDVLKNRSHSQNQTKLLKSNNIYYHSPSCFFGNILFSETSTNTKSLCSIKLYDNESVCCDIVRNRYWVPTCGGHGAVRITMEEVREYLKELYCTPYNSMEEKNFTNTLKLLKNPFKSIYNNLSNLKKRSIIKNRKTHTFVDRKKKLKSNICYYTTDPEKLNSNDKVKSHSTRRNNFSVNFKQILRNVFHIKKLQFSHHNLCSGINNVCSSKKSARLSNNKNQNQINLKIKPLFAERALPPLPRLQDGHKNTIHKECNSLHELKENYFALPPPLPPQSSFSSTSLKFKPGLTTSSVDFATSIEKVKNYGWYWGPISGEAAEKILTNEPDGSFIVRDSSDDYYIFSLTFKLNSIIRHVRIEHDQGNFSFGNSTRFKSHTIVDFIESAVEHSRSGRYLFFLHRRPVLGPMRVQLLHPVSRFKEVQSLQHLSRFVILKVVRKDLISSLPLPTRLLNYLSTQHYYSENLTDEERIELPEKDNVNEFIRFAEDSFS